jgi:hypothetical protein
MRVVCDAHHEMEGVCSQLLKSVTTSIPGKRTRGSSFVVELKKAKADA